VPGDDIVPNISSYRYLKTKNEIREKKRPPKEISEIYAYAVNAFAHGVIGDVFSSDPNETVRVVSFIGYSQLSQDGSGVRKQVVSLRLTKKEYARRIFGASANSASPK
jgi:hypothetical protein